MTTSTGVFVFAGAATGLMGALNPLVTGVVLKLEASKTAEIDSRAIERATCSAQAWVELFCCFFIELFGLNQFSCFSARFTELRIAEISRQILVVLGGHSRGDPSRVVLVIRAAAAGSLGEIFRFRIDVSILNLLAVGILLVERTRSRRKWRQEECGRALVCEGKLMRRPAWRARGPSANRGR